MKYKGYHINYSLLGYNNKLPFIEITSTDKINTQKVNYLKSLLTHLYKHIFSEYTFQNNTITITTYFPQVYKLNIKHLINILLEGEKYYDKYKDKIYHSIKQILGSPSDLAIFNCAIKRKLPITTFKLGEKYYNQIGFGASRCIFRSASTFLDSKQSKTIQTSKELSNILAEKIGFPVPKWFIVRNKKSLLKAYKEFDNVDIVIKPYNLTRGMGVYVGVKDEKQLIKYYENIKGLYKSKQIRNSKQLIMLQKRVIGKDYRLLCINGELKIATERVPSYIIGDGVHNVEWLINQENRNPLRDKSSLMYVLKPIIIDNTMLEYLKEQGYSLKYIPSNKQKLYIRKAASVSQGGFTIDVTPIVHKEIKILCERLCKFMKVYTAGIDIMCNDISKPIKDNCNFIEVNTSPEMYLNIYPSEGKQYEDIMNDFINGTNPNNINQPIIYISNIDEHHKHLKKINKLIFDNNIPKKDYINTRLDDKSNNYSHFFDYQLLWIEYSNLNSQLLIDLDFYGNKVLFY